MHGHRYITADELISYCTKMNITEHLSLSQLEQFEREGVLIPVARELDFDDNSVEYDEPDSQSVVKIGRAHV